MTVIDVIDGSGPSLPSMSFQRSQQKSPGLKEQLRLTLENGELSKPRDPSRAEQSLLLRNISILHQASG